MYVSGVAVANMVWVSAQNERASLTVWSLLEQTVNEVSALTLNALTFLRHWSEPARSPQLRFGLQWGSALER